MRTPMRVIGNRTSPLPGSTGPSNADVAASQEIAMAAPRTVPKGIHRYRSHAEADEDARKWAIDGMVERNLELAESARTTGPKIR